MEKPDLEERVLREGKPGNNCEMKKKKKVCLALKCPNIGPFYLGEGTRM